MRTRQRGSRTATERMGTPPFGDSWCRFCVTAVVALLVLVTGCATSGQVYIDYIDFVQFNGVNYVHRPAYPPLSAALVGQHYADVKAQLQDHNRDPNYKPKDGDAAFLAPGTAVYTVTGYRPTFRLAVQLPSGLASGSGYVYYESAAPLPGAHLAGDWLDIRDKVALIGVNQDYADTSQRGEISDPNQVNHLVDMLLDTPFGAPKPTGGASSVFVSFHLVDGTRTILPFALSTGAITETLRAPQTFADAIHSAYASGTPGA